MLHVVGHLAHEHWQFRGRVPRPLFREEDRGHHRVVDGDNLALARRYGRYFASPDVMAAVSRARGLLDPALHRAEALRALCGLLNYHLIQFESPQCLALAEPFLGRHGDTPTKAVIHYLAGTPCLHLGQFERSICHLEAVLALYDEAACRPVAFVAGYHLRSFTLIWRGLARLYVGERAADGGTPVADDFAAADLASARATLRRLARAGDRRRIYPRVADSSRRQHSRPSAASEGARAKPPS